MRRSQSSSRIDGVACSSPVAERSLWTTPHNCRNGSRSVPATSPTMLIGRHWQPRLQTFSDLARSSTQPAISRRGCSTSCRSSSGGVRSLPTSRCDGSSPAPALNRSTRVGCCSSEAMRGGSPRAGAAAYSIAQAASETLRRALQAEWADSGTAVGAFKCGLVDSDMVRRFMSLSEAEFPAIHAYEEYVADGLVASPRDIARFAAWLLLDIPTQRFAATEWDVRDVEHHAEWCDRPLYPHADPATRQDRR